MTDVMLRVDEHFESLRDAVWAKLRARHGILPRDRFEDAYSEWWTREVERAAGGRPTSAAAPAAFVAEAVHRVLIDESRARARGLARDRKAELEVLDLDDHREAHTADDTAANAHYEAVAHRVLQLVRDRLAPRELKVFVWSFLYLQTTERTAAALGLTAPRVKKDRARVAGKVGAEVWALLTADLALCSAYQDRQLPAVFESLTSHVEDCAECAQELGRVRRGAAAAVAPVELLALDWEPAIGVLDRIVARSTLAVQRAVDAAMAMPPGGRVAVIAAVAVTALGQQVAGGSAASPPGPPAPVARAATVPMPGPPFGARPVADAPAAAATRRRLPARKADRRPQRPRRKAKREVIRAVARPALAPKPPAESATATVAPTVAPSVAGAAPSAHAHATRHGGEFGFEQR